MEYKLEYNKSYNIQYTYSNIRHFTQNVFKWQPPNDPYQQDQNQQPAPPPPPRRCALSNRLKLDCDEDGRNMKWKWIPQPGRAGHKRSAGQLRTMCRDADEIPISPQWAIVDWSTKSEHFQDISRLQWGENTEYEFA